MTRATGTFEVKLTPQSKDEVSGASTLSRLSIDKRFLGDLDATSVGEMLAVGTSVPGSAAYVAIERVSGALHGRHGTFVLKHDGTMRRGVASLTLGVVPDSGTGDLTGLDGVMQIIIEGRQHSYVFDHTLDAGG